MRQRYARRAMITSSPAGGSLDVSWPIDCQQTARKSLCLKLGVQTLSIFSFESLLESSDCFVVNMIGSSKLLEKNLATGEMCSFSEER